MPDYSKSKIYKLQCDDGYYYIGSTRNELRIRLYDHKQGLKKNPTMPVYQHIATIGWKRVRMILIEEYSCDNREQLLQHEDIIIRQHLADPLCLNRNRVCITEQEARDYFKKGDDTIARRDFEKKKQTDAEYYQRKRKEMLVPHTCVCGSTITTCGKSRHEKTAKHQTFLASQQ
jgi:GIY-YIG catalytic domain.